MEDVMDAVCSGEFDFDDPVWDLISEQAQDFVRYLLTYEEEERPTALQALQHPWLVNERRASNESFLASTKRRSTMSQALEQMQGFDAAESKLKQATYALLASQLLDQQAREEIDKVFRLLDADCSGQLTKDEVQTGFSEYYNRTLTDKAVDDLFTRVNFSGSGEIGKPPFSSSLLKV